MEKVTKKLLNATFKELAKVRDDARRIREGKFYCCECCGSDPCDCEDEQTLYAARGNANTAIICEVNFAPINAFYAIELVEFLKTKLKHRHIDAFVPSFQQCCEGTITNMSATAYDDAHKLDRYEEEMSFELPMEFADAFIEWVATMGGYDKVKPLEQIKWTATTEVLDIKSNDR